ncbi:hypothetical protein HPCPY6311_0377 [Helicobacter pylori CPY6311]|nr:hypothetical protein HPCPY6311_0377 [Helicobacter pylori CPY6311]
MHDFHDCPFLKVLSPLIITLKEYQKKIKNSLVKYSLKRIGGIWAIP